MALRSAILCALLVWQVAAAARIVVTLKESSQRPVENLQRRVLSEREQRVLHVGPENEHTVYPLSRVLEFEALGKRFELVLEKQLTLMSENYHEKTVYADGTTAVKLRHEVMNCFYTGHVRGDSASSVVLETCNGVRGHIQGHGESFQISPDTTVHTSTARSVHTVQAASEALSVPHVLEHTRDLPRPQSDQNWCGVGHNHGTSSSAPFSQNTPMHSHDHDHEHHHTEAEAHSHPHVESVAHSPVAAPAHFRTQSIPEDYVQMLVINDKERMVQDTTIDRQQQSLTWVLGVMDRYKESPNIKDNVTVVNIILVGQISYVGSQPVSIAVNSGEINTQTYLRGWSQWAWGLESQYNSPNTANIADFLPVDEVSVYSGYDFGGGTIGLGWVGGLLAGYYSTLVVQTLNYASNTPFVITVHAHELGHNYGMCHDPEPSLDVPRKDTTCDNSTVFGTIIAANANACKGFIMSVYASDDIATQFSLCSQRDTAKWRSLFYSSGTALNMPGGGTAVCGNTKVEGSETCDCGAKFYNLTSCSSAPGEFAEPCCEAATCQRISGYAANPTCFLNVTTTVASASRSVTSGGYINSRSLTVTLTFNRAISEPVASANVTLSGAAAAGATSSYITTSGSTIKYALTTSVDGAITVNVPAGIYTASRITLTNQVGTAFSFTIDTVVPKVERLACQEPLVNFLIPDMGGVRFETTTLVCSIKFSEDMQSSTVTASSFSLLQTTSTVYQADQSAKIGTVTAVDARNFNFNITVSDLSALLELRLRASAAADPSLNYAAEKKYSVFKAETAVSAATLAVNGALTFNVPFDSNTQDAFKANFTSELATVLGFPTSRIQVNSIGGTNTTEVGFVILPSATNTTSASTIMSALEVQYGNAGSALRTATTPVLIYLNTAATWASGSAVSYSQCSNGLWRPTGSCSLAGPPTPAGGSDEICFGSRCYARNVVIGVAVAVGFVALFLIFLCVRKCCWSSKEKRTEGGRHVEMSSR